jgi:Mn-dependent DtxR family transcriptional regulator
MQVKIDAKSPDEFVMNLLDLAAEDVYEAAEAHRLSLKNPAKTVAEYLNTLESRGLVRTVAELRLALL